MKVTLYTSTHNKTGLVYFGKTTKYHSEDELQQRYHGSGVYWNRHLKKYGDDVTMKIYWTGDESDVEMVALKYSEQYNIVESNKYANMVVENGLDGGATRNGAKLTEEHICRFGRANKGKIRSDVTRNLLSVAHLGNKPGNYGKKMTHFNPNYVVWNKGVIGATSHTANTRSKISKGVSKLWEDDSYRRNKSQKMKNKKWVCNQDTRESKMVDEVDEVDVASFINDGWELGRKLKLRSLNAKF